MKKREKRASQGWRGARAIIALVALMTLLAALSGCSYLRRPQSQPKAEISKLLIGTNDAGRTVTLRSLQIEVMRFADNYAALVARAADEYSAQAASAEARVVATKWKLEQATAAYVNASGPNPIINLLDVVVLATASRMVMEDNVKQPPYGMAAKPLLDVHQKLEASAWTMGSGVMRREQEQELKELIVEWRRANPVERNVTGLRFREFMSALGKTPQRASSSPTSIFSLLFLDPMASMDPTTAAIEETRNTAERAMYYTQRMPALLNWQVELLTYELAVQPETRQVLADTARFSKSSEAFAKTAEQLPKVINDQREAAIKQLLEGLAPEEKKVKELLAEARSIVVEARETLKIGGSAAQSVDAAITNLARFVASVTETNETSESKKSRPFDVLDYATAARDIGGAAKELTALLASANDSAVRLREMRRQTAADANSVIDHAFRRGLTLIAVFLCGAFLAGILYRAVTSRFRTRPRPVVVVASHGEDKR